MPNKVRVLLVLALIALAAGAFWKLRGASNPADELTLYGNVDQRLVSLAFDDPERVVEVLVEEGESVRPGQVLARLEAARLRERMTESEAAVAEAGAVLERLKNGTRQEEIDQARASVAAAKAEAIYAKEQHERYLETWQRSRGNAISKLQVEEANARRDVAEARFEREKKVLALALAGTRQEEIIQAEAALRVRLSRQAQFARQLQDTELKSPAHAVVRSPLLEPGDMASPTRPVFSLAVVSPKWVRTYVSEADLGRVRPGMQASVFIDSFPQEPLAGMVSFISPNAEFTPKTVQTPELRTSLVYEIRILVADPRDVLRLGMPATAVLRLEAQNDGR